MIEKITGTKLLYKGKFLDFIEDAIEIETEPVIQAIRQYFVHPGGVCVVPVLDDGSIILVEQFRTPLGKLIYEIPAGKRDAGEEPFMTATRELQEETGYTATRWTDLGHIYPCPGYSTEILYMYLAQGLVPGKQNLDHGELVNVVKMPIAKAIEMIHAGLIPDAKTISGIFLAKKYLDID
jgi:ADP-ribose pyrophosphatase